MMKKIAEMIQKGTLVNCPICNDPFRFIGIQSIREYQDLIIREFFNERIQTARDEMRSCERIRDKQLWQDKICILKELLEEWDEYRNDN